MISNHRLRRASIVLLCMGLTAAPLKAEGSAPPAPPKFPTVDEVEFTPGDVNTFTAKVVGPREVPMRSLLAVSFCRAEKEKTARGFDGWYPGQVQQIYGISKDTPQIVIATIAMFRGSPPEGKTPVTKDWCAELAALSQPPAPTGGLPDTTSP